MNGGDKSRFAAWPGNAYSIAGALLLLICLLLGGGGAEAPGFNGIIEALGALLLVACVAVHFRRAPMPSEAAAPVACTALLLLLFAFQLLPLPPALWVGLPGRELAAETARLTGQVGSWKSLSLDPEATRRAASGLLLPVALMLVVIRSDGSGLRWLLRSLLAGAGAGAVLGAVQIARDTPAALTLYGDPVPGVGTGFFANPNHQASLMLLALIAVGLLVRLQEPKLKMRIGARNLKFKLGWLLAPLFIVGVLATQSRAGLLLFLPALAIAIIASGNRRAWGVSLIVGLGLAGFLGMALLTRAGLWEMLPGGSEFLKDARATSLPDILYTLRQYWPWGSGFGTFAPVFMANEDLDLAQAGYLNHAHNDYLELIVEAGLPGAIVLFVIIMVIAWRMLAVARDRARDRGPALAGFAMLALLAAHSLVDYPVRSDAIAAVAGVAIGLLFVPLSRKNHGSSRKRGKRGFSSPGLSGGSPQGRAR